MSKDAIADLEKMVAGLKGSGNYQIEFPLPALSQKKAQSLQDNDRDMFEATNKMEKNIIKALDILLKAHPEMLYDKDALSKLLDAAAISAKETVVERFEAGGGDISVRPLKPSTVRAKGNSKVGVDKGVLLNDIKRCKPQVIGK
jgi:hypothetical protein